MMSEKDLEQILDRYLRGTASEQEVKWVEKWYSSMDSMNGYPRLTKNEEGILDRNGLEHIRKRIRRKKEIVAMWPVLAKSAAVLLVGLTLIYLLIIRAPVSNDADKMTAVSQEEIINTSSEKKLITLPDSTQVSLEQNSRLQFSTADFNKARQITLEGGASFAVARDEDRPFQVFTFDVITTVLGTSFTIEAPSDKQKITVSVHTGRVSVSRKNNPGILDNDAQEIIVTPNQQAVFDPESKVLTATLVPEPVSLIKRKNNKVIFDEEPIINILQDIQMLFGVKIEYNEKALGNCRITTAFSDEGLYERLNILSRAIGASYGIEGTRIRFNSNGCVTN
ncbi:MAG TPA: FecR domain-containing protein [Chryseosolibacter sp.]